MAGSTLLRLALAVMQLRVAVHGQFCPAGAACSASSSSSTLTAGQLGAARHAAHAVGALQQQGSDHAVAAWHSARAAVDAAAAACDGPQREGCTPAASAATADMARLLAVMATEHWAYWLAWRESQQILHRWLPRRSADLYLQQAQDRWPQLWPGWAGSTALSSRAQPPLPLEPPLGQPAQRHVPFLPPEVWVWDLPESPTRLQRDRLLSRAAVALFVGHGENSTTASGRLANDEFFASQNRWHSRTGYSVFEEPAVPTKWRLATTGQQQPAAAPVLLSPDAFAELQGILSQAVQLGDGNAGIGCGPAAARRSMMVWASVHGPRSPGHGEHGEAPAC